MGNHELVKELIRQGSVVEARSHQGGCCDDGVFSVARQYYDTSLPLTCRPDSLALGCSLGESGELQSSRGCWGQSERADLLRKEYTCVMLLDNAFEVLV